MTEYFVYYKPDHSKSFFYQATTCDDSLDPDGEVLDYIMSLPDGDLGNYKIYVHIIGE